MVVIPLAVLIWFSFAPDGHGGAAFARQLPAHGAEPAYARFAIKTLWTAGIAAVLTAALAWCPAWALSRLPPRLRNLILLAIVIPYLTSYLLLIYSIFVVLGPGSPIMVLARLLGLALPAASILYTQAATVVMLVYENLPLMIFVLFSGMQRVDGSHCWRRPARSVPVLAAHGLYRLSDGGAGTGLRPRHGFRADGRRLCGMRRSSAVRMGSCSAMSSPTR